MGAESRVYRPLEPLSHLQTVNYDAQIMGDSGQKCRLWGERCLSRQRYHLTSVKFNSRKGLTNF